MARTRGRGASRTSATFVTRLASGATETWVVERSGTPAMLTIKRAARPPAEPGLGSLHPLDPAVRA